MNVRLIPTASEIAEHLYMWSVLKCLRMSPACSTDALRLTSKLNSYIVIPCITIKQVTHVIPTNSLFYNARMQSFT